MAINKLNKKEIEGVIAKLDKVIFMRDEHYDKEEAKAFVEVIQKMLRVHATKAGKELRFMQLLINAIGINDSYNMTNSQLLESLEDTYEK